MPPPPSARVHASCLNFVPSISSTALQIESCASRMILSNLDLVLRISRMTTPVAGSIAIATYVLSVSTPGRSSEFGTVVM